MLLETYFKLHLGDKALKNTKNKVVRVCASCRKTVVAARLVEQFIGFTHKNLDHPAKELRTVWEKFIYFVHSEKYTLVRCSTVASATFFSNINKHGDSQLSRHIYLNRART